MNLDRRMHFFSLAELKRGLVGYGRKSVINMKLCFERGNWSLQLIEQWSQFFQTCNWYTFNFILVEFEDDRALGDLEIKFILLGVGFRISWNHTLTDTRRELYAQVTRIENQESVVSE